MWNLAEGLVSATGKNSLPDAIEYLGLFPPSTGPYELAIVRDWWPAGAETYALVFSVVNGNHERRAAILKSYISLGSRPSDRLRTLLARRAAVSSLGIETPQLHCADGADLYEEFIAYDARQALRSEGTDPQAIIRAASDAVGLLLRAGYAPKTLHDARSNGKNFVLVDFGEDLGVRSGPGRAQPADFQRLMDSALGQGWQEVS